VADEDLLATDGALVARMKEVRGHIEEMPDAERVFMLGALCGALERHLDSEPSLPALDREALGRRVREVWVACAPEGPDLKPSHLVPWDELDDWNREVDMRIGDALWNMLVPPSAEIMRPGRKLIRTGGPCTLYVVTGSGPDADECIGLVVTAEIAGAVCNAVNARGIPLPGTGESGA
jgi:hypothetical protein